MPFIFAFVFCVVLIYILRSCSAKIGLIDFPGGRKQHDLPTPTVGGVAMYLSLLLTMVFFDSFITNKLRMLVGCAGLLVVLGILDDKHGLSVSLRIMIQVFLVLTLILGADGVIYHFGSIFGSGDINLGLLAIPFSVLAIVGNINAMNMIDGADGMAGKMAIITTIGLSVIFYLSGASELMVFAGTMIGALLGFLIFNTQIFFRRAWVFMGDAGSMWIGLVLGWFMVQLTHGVAPAEPAVVLWLLGIPLLDTVVVVFRRLKRKRSPFDGDRTHIHHVMENMGHSIKRSVLMLSLVQIMLVGAGVVFYLTSAPAWVVFWGFGVLMVAYYYRFNNC